MAANTQTTMKPVRIIESDDWLPRFICQIQVWASSHGINFKEVRPRDRNRLNFSPL